MSAAGQATGKQFKITTAAMLSTCRATPTMVGVTYTAASMTMSPTQNYGHTGCSRWPGS